MKEGIAWEEKPELADLFRARGLLGTFVVQANGVLRGFDRARANTRYIPASTFKIANTLIGLSTGVVASVDEIVPYKGEANPFIQEWARAMSLREAIAISNVPIYQELARRIGIERMSRAVRGLKYGSADIGSVVDRFWLDGPLATSAVEQAIFLGALARGQLPLPSEHQRSVREITVTESGRGWTIHSKTGWQNAPGAGVAWWVGWVNRDGNTHAFALNMDVKDATDANCRVALGKAALRALGILPVQGDV